MKENPKHIRISDYDYPLPDERIAKFLFLSATIPSCCSTVTGR
jgi:hypothetical protein